ncbi:bifunctional diaminohydroxyphosphoribosylaminopyrimidine deaminase/5-amino-6-(5-phosphoribosylamino)uracil reductase RibD [Lacticaseibacillus saniviri]|uniref:bifunctional diaminohydroxyphosphoribosylaminopyrimidine deaminase/5-amino-6-(5-phosphoribosylamino)uracil reductase RibD n=1 Tax=Lacticaseibacillus saniviri TaxID=931533 RepID=UPI001CDA853A|nr:bifunctional diaminohydroxyphosphoribosylaminopyrimidine deaminase/5-amino-6-(5-phosphoribosylamino)uracil reductase RibD [Lacticaseibacillus saniviri]
MSEITDSEYMALAVQAAQKGNGHTWTNPMVGAVIVKQQHVLAVGYHHRFGEAHAEIDALNQLASSADARGATMYVTLEPCSHFGKTPPCAKRLVSVGLRRVVIGQIDPNPLVAGKGIAILRTAGIAVEILATTQGLNPAYNFFYQHQRPQVTLKYAMSLDGKINAAQKHAVISPDQRLTEIASNCGQRIRL